MCSVVQFGGQVIGSLYVVYEYTYFTPHPFEILLEVQLSASPCAMIVPMVAHGIFSLELPDFHFELYLLSCFNPGAFYKFQVVRSLITHIA